MKTLRTLLFAAVCLIGLAALPSQSFASPGRRNSPPVVRRPVVVVYVQYIAPSRPLPLLPLATINAPCLPPRYVYGRRW